MGRRPFQRTTHGDQQREIGHVQKDGRQQLEEAPLPRIDLGQRHGEHGDDE